MLTIEYLNKSFGKKQVLTDISFAFQNKCYVLLGPNGAGKTTLLRCIAGIYQDYQGRITMEKGKNIGYLSQKFGAYYNLTVKETLEYVALMKEISDVREQVDKSMDMTHLNDYSDYKVKKLSGGMLRRLGIAQAILGQPEVLLLDEPSVGLDPKERADFLRNLKELDFQGTMIVSTHILDDVKKIADEVIVMNNGVFLPERITEFDGTLEEKYLCLIEEYS